MAEIAGIGVLSAFLAGVVSFLSPCVLPLVPGYVSFVAGRSVDDLAERRFSRARLATLGLSASFVVGFSVIFIALGASATAIGQLFQSYRYQADLIAGTVVALFGLHMMGILRLGWLNREWRAQPGGGAGTPVGAFVLGTAFAFGWTPCIGPILGAILTIGGTTMDVGGGVALLSIYSLGLAVPFLLVAAFTGAFLGRIRGLSQLGRYVQLLSGAILLLVGVAIMTGTLTSFGTWLLQTIPAFQYVVI